MKVAYCSDIHLEMNNPDLSVFANVENADLLILAGDIITAYSIPYCREKYEQFFDYVSKQFPNVIYIVGNHEYYKSIIPNAQLAIKQFLLPYDNVVFLNDESVEICGKVFFGGTMWTDMNNSDPGTMYNIKRIMNDFRMIHNKNGFFLLPCEVVEMHKNYLSALDDCIQSTDKEVVVISHHSPSTITIKPQYKENFHMNGGYCSDLSRLIDSFKIKHWFFGHQHQRESFELFGCKLYCNCHGYEMYEQSFVDQFKVKIVEIL